MKISSLGEFGLIDRIRKNAPLTKGVVRGIGDDAAVLEFNSKEHLLFTTDMLVEDVHFIRRAPSAAIGHKALACNVSDIAAMGGIPTFAVISLGISPAAQLSLVEEIYSGINKLARRFNIAIVGGDTVKSRKLTINIALLGRVAKKDLVLRCGAKAGDRIFVTGKLGRSLPTGRHLSFLPRLAESQFLVKQIRPSAMIDVSDGLAADLGHILEESKVGATIYEGLIPLNKGASTKNALYDGEDFELVFTLSAKAVDRLQASRAKFSFCEVGYITEEKGLRLVKRNSRKINISMKGFEHF